VGDGNTDEVDETTAFLGGDKAERPVSVMVDVDGQPMRVRVGPGRLGVSLAGAHRRFQSVLTNGSDNFGAAAAHVRFGGHSGDPAVD